MDLCSGSADFLGGAAANCLRRYRRKRDRLDDPSPQLGLQRRLRGLPCLHICQALWANVQIALSRILKNQKTNNRLILDASIRDHRSDSFTPTSSSAQILFHTIYRILKLLLRRLRLTLRPFYRLEGRQHHLRFSKIPTDSNGMDHYSR